MRARILGHVGAAALAVLVLGTTSPAVAAGPGDGSSDTMPRLTVDSVAGGTLVLSAPVLGPGDRIEVTGTGAPRGIPEGWRLDRAESAEGRFTLVREGSLGAVRGETIVVAPADEPPLVSIYRLDGATGDELQAHAWVLSGDDGAVRLVPAGASRVRNMVRITPPEGMDMAGMGLEADPGGRIVLRAADPRVEDLERVAVHVEPFVEASPLGAVAIEAVGSVVGSNTSNTYFSDRPCTGTWFGSVIDISTAPVGTEVVEAEVDFTVWHSIDVSRFRSGLWHKVGGSWTDFVEVYSGTSSGFNTLTRTVSGINAFDGTDPNTQYILASCNQYATPEDAYLDEWTLTVYFTEASGTVDLVADSVSTVYSTVAVGGQLGYYYQGHVAGSGDVGSSFNTGIVLSTDATITIGDRLLQTVPEALSLSAGDTFGTVYFSREVIIPADVIPGSYWLGTFVDNGMSVPETNESNNTAATPITVVAASSKPNLVTSDCSVSPATASPGDTVTLTYRSRNTGSTGAAYFSWATFISDDATYDHGSDQMVTGLDVPGGWEAGYDSGTVTTDITLDASLSGGVHHVGFVVDPGDGVPETNETDNWCTAAVTVQGGGGGSGITWLIPAAASAPGLNESDWRTQISIVNAGTQTRTASVYYVASGATYPGVLLTGPITLQPNRGRYLDDPLAGLRPTAGMLYVVTDGYEVVITSRTFNQKTGGERFGQGIPAKVVGGPHCVSEWVLPLANTGPGEYHTNLGLVQTDDETYTVEVTLYSSGGTVLATKQYTQNIAYRQITDIFGNMGLSPDFSAEGAWIRVKLVDGCPDSWTTYASIVDDTTGDPTFVGPRIPSFY